MSLLCIFFTTMAMAQKPSQPVAPIKVTASIDTAAVTMGERTTLHVEYLKNGHEGSVLLPINEPKKEGETLNIAGVEIRQIDADSVDLGNNRIQVSFNLLLQPFEPNDYILPPFKFALDNDTFTSNPIALKVLEPEMPQEMVDSLFINPLRPPMEIEAEWYDWIPDIFADYWYFWVGGLVLAALIVAIIILYRKNGKSILPRKKVVPPYELATRRLEELRRKRLHELGNNKAYYTELT